MLLSRAIHVTLVLLGLVAVANAVRCHTNDDIAGKGTFNTDTVLHEKYDDFNKDFKDAQRCDACMYAQYNALNTLIQQRGCVYYFQMLTRHMDEVQTVTDIGSTIQKEVRYCAYDYCNYKLEKPPSMRCYHNYDRHTGIIYPHRKTVGNCKACIYFGNFYNDRVFGTSMPDLYECSDQMIPDLWVNSYPPYNMFDMLPNTCNRGEYEGVTIKFMICDTGDKCVEECSNGPHVGVGYGTGLAVLACLVTSVFWK